MSSTWLNWAYIKVDAQNIPLTLKHIESGYSKFVTDRDFSYSFVDEDVEEQYKAEKNSLKYLLFSLF